MTNLRRRLERLEVRAMVTSRRTVVRVGRLHKLPQDYKGERHVIISKRFPKEGDHERVEFQEVPGPDPGRDPEIYAADVGTVMEIRLVGMPKSTDATPME